MSRSLKNQRPPAMPAEHTDAHTETTLPTLNGLNARQEAFCRLYAGGIPAADAYESAYCSSSRSVARAAAIRLLRNPAVVARVRELQDAAAGRAMRSTAVLIAELEEMVSADVSELMRLDVGACRWCWGKGGGYQWRDAAELAGAVARYRGSLKGANPLPSPDASGGLGYRADRDPNPECQHCDGAGIPRVKFASTADCSPGARRLLRGIELFPDGSIKRVLLHNQMEARIELHRLRGLHVERSVNFNVNANLPAIENWTLEQRLDFLQSIQPAST